MGTISGPGAAGATVSLTGASTATTTADASGNYSFSGLANGSYTVTPSNAGYMFTPSSQTVTINGAHAMNVNFTSAAQTYSISGTISGPGGAGATVNLSGNSTRYDDRRRFRQLQLRRTGERFLHGDTNQWQLHFHACQPKHRNQRRKHLRAQLQLFADGLFRHCKSCLCDWRKYAQRARWTLNGRLRREAQWLRCRSSDTGAAQVPAERDSGGKCDHSHLQGDYQPGGRATPR